MNPNSTAKLATNTAQAEANSMNPNSQSKPGDIPVHDDTQGSQSPDDMHTVSFSRGGDTSGDSEMWGNYSTKAQADQAVNDIKKWASTFNDPDWGVTGIKVTDLGGSAAGGLASKTGAVMPSLSDLSMNTTVVDLSRGGNLVTTASDLAANYRKRKVKYQSPGDASHGGHYSDCSRFVNDALNRAGWKDAPYVTAQRTNKWIATNPYYQSVSPKDASAGDILVGPKHMGIYTGRKNRYGFPIIIQMGRHGPDTIPWTDPNPKYYRPSGTPTTGNDSSGSSDSQSGASPLPPLPTDSDSGD